MNAVERVVAHIAIAGVLAGSLAAVALNAELFPFSSYPMYSGVSRVPYQLGKVFGVVRDGDGEHEVPLDRSAYVFPFTDRTLRNAVSRLLREDGREAATSALVDQLAVYNARVPLHGGPTLEAIRYYTMILEPAGDGGLVARRGALLVEAVRP